MENHEFRFGGIMHSGVESGFVGFKLQRNEGTELGVVLRIDDAKRLFEELRIQVGIAADDSN